MTRYIRISRPPVLDSQNGRESNKIDQLKAVHTELAYQMSEKIKRAAELIVANKKLVFEESEKLKRAAELIIANTELVFQNSEKEKRAGELVLAKKELKFQNSEKVKRAAELILANIELVFQNEERGKRAKELLAVNRQLKKIRKEQKEYIKGLEELMFITSHAVRLPVTNIIGLATQLEGSHLSGADKELIDGMKNSALALDVFTQELTSKINNLKGK
ncbi:hypothetical protein FLAN108750_01000 [Flavobacterium antarcticum]|uniref:hypothetical protein n=1 Tax=Flavobacterium antarcticum TaxID=271155 RepID=UPI0003B7BA82|nr:hypothetical protein [Flavobacterium antarcticum]